LQRLEKELAGSATEFHSSWNRKLANPPMHPTPAGKKASPPLHPKSAVIV